MTWKLSKYGRDKFGCTELESFISNKSHEWIPDGSSFVLKGMGIGHFYLEDYSKESEKPAASIFFNENHSVCLHDPVVAIWVN